MHLYLLNYIYYSTQLLHGTIAPYLLHGTPPANTPPTTRHPITLPVTRHPSCQHPSDRDAVIILIAVCQHLGRLVQQLTPLVLISIISK